MFEFAYISPAVGETLITAGMRDTLETVFLFS